MPCISFSPTAFQKYPHHTAIFFYGTEFTYAELESLTNKFANSLAALGIVKGDRVAPLHGQLPPVRHRLLRLYEGGRRRRANPRPWRPNVSWPTSSATREPGGSSPSTYLWPKAKAVMNDSTLEFAVVGSLYDDLPIRPVPCKPFSIPDAPVPFERQENVYAFSSLLNNACTFTPPAMNSRKDLAVLQYTSGTTGFPKGVMVTHYNLVSYISILRNMDYKSRDGEEVYPVTLPMSHNYAMFQTVVAPVAMGGKIVIMVRFHPDEALRVIDTLHPTIFRAVPTMLAMMAAHPGIKGFDLHSVRHWIVGGAPVPDELVAKFQEVSGANVVEGYGLTESTSGVVLNSLYEKTHKGMGFPRPVHGRPRHRPDHRQGRPHRQRGGTAPQGAGHQRRVLGKAGGRQPRHSRTDGSTRATWCACPTRACSSSWTASRR